MPPKPTFNKDDILKSAFKLLRKEGFNEVTARNLADEMKMSVAPIYSNLESMKNLYIELARASKLLLLDYQLKNWTENKFLNMGIGYIMFAKKEKKVFEWMYSKGFPNSVEIDVFYKAKAIEVMKADKNLSQLNDDNLEEILLKMKIFAHGLADLIRIGQIKMDKEEIKKLFIEIGVSMKEGLSGHNT